MLKNVKVIDDKVFLQYLADKQIMYQTNPDTRLITVEKDVYFDFSEYDCDTSILHY